MIHLTLQYSTNMSFWQLLHTELFTSRCDITCMDEFTIILLILISVIILFILIGVLSCLGNMISTLTRILKENQ